MPRMDQTGPQGLGPMTGGGRGRCAGGEGRGRGSYGRGRGMRHEYHATGLTGWERGVRENPQSTGRRVETLERIEAMLSDVERRLQHLENTRKT